MPTPDVVTLNTIIAAIIAAIGFTSETQRDGRITGPGILVLALLLVALCLSLYDHNEEPHRKAWDTFHRLNQDFGYLLQVRGIQPLYDERLDEYKEAVQRDLKYVRDERLAIQVVAKLCALYTGVGRRNDARALRREGYKYIDRMTDQVAAELAKAYLLIDEAETELFSLKAKKARDRSLEAQAICKALMDSMPTHEWVDSMCATKLHAFRIEIAALRVCGRERAAADSCRSALDDQSLASVLGSRPLTQTEIFKLHATYGSTLEAIAAPDSALAHYGIASQVNDEGYRHYVGALADRVWAMKKKYSRVQIDEAEKFFAERPRRWFALTIERLKNEIFIEMARRDKLDRETRKRIAPNLIFLHSRFSRWGDEREMIKIKRDLYEYYQLAGDRAQAAAWSDSLNRHKPECN